MDSVWAPIATVLVAVVSGLVTYLLAKRKGSGSVKTSEATELWQANSEFRTMLIQEARDRSLENTKLREEAAILRDKVSEAHEMQSLLEARIAMLEKEIRRLKTIAGEPL